MTEIRTSIIIVTYNVAGFISFCLESILKSERAKAVEIVVVDNNSSDDSVAIIRKKYPAVQLVINDTNLGFSKACNQGADIAKGSTLIFLNPDCIVEESAIGRLVSTTNQKDVGLVGPVLVDGAGHVLPESAREVPTTLSGLNKILGLPFNESFPYYRQLSKAQTIEAPVLCGACMAVRSEVFEEIGGFDERFFMYGEDVDISVQSLKRGYKNLCLTDVRVLHFKGESTDKKDLQNNYNFYNAIKLYVEKHSLEIVGLSTKMGIGLFATSFSKANYASQKLKEWSSMFLDFIIVVLCMWTLQFIWSYVKINDWYFYGPVQYIWHYIGYGLVWVMSLYISGAYFVKKRVGSKVFKYALFGGVALLLIYALLPESLRFSRMILVLSILIVPIFLALKHGLRSYNKGGSYFMTGHSDDKENERFVHSILSSNSEELESKLNSGDELIFDFSSIKVSEMLEHMTKEREGRLTFKFWDKEGQKLFSSADRSKMGESSDSMAHYHLNQRTYLLQKRIVDVSIAVLLYIPFAILSKFNMGALHEVIRGDKTIVGYDAAQIGDVRLPPLVPSIISCCSSVSNQKEIDRVAIDYAANYTIFDDIFIVVARFKHLTKVIMKGKVEVHEGRN